MDQSLLGKFDVVVAVGVFGGGHIPKSGYDDAHAMLRPGGHFVACIRKKYTDRDNEEEGFHDKMQELISSQKFVLEKDWVFERGNADANFAEHTRMETYMFVCRRVN